MNKRLTLSLLAAALVLFVPLGSSEIRSEQSVVPVPCVSLDSTGVDVNEWLAIGPFQAASADLLGETPLNQFGINEDELSMDLKSAILRCPQAVRRIEEASRPAMVDLHLALSHPLKAGEEDLIAYVCTEIASPTARKAWLLLGTDDEARVWLNGKAIWSSQVKRPLFAWDNVVELDLLAGTNCLAVKVGNFDGPWGIVAQIHPTTESACAALVERRGRLIDHSIVSQHSDLRILNDKVFVPATLDGKLVDLHSGTVTPIRFVDGCNHIESPPGFYRLEYRLLNTDLNEFIYIGTIARMYDDMALKCKSYTGPDRVRLGLETYLRRVEVISKAEDQNKTVNDWDRGILTRDLDHKAIFAASRFFEAYSKAETGKDPFKDALGLQIRAFRSRLDDTVQHYRLFVPSSYSREHSPLPLIVVVHPIFSVQRPFIEGVAIANHEEAEMWSQTAERLGVGVLWAGYRLCPYGHPIEFEYLDEVLESVETDYAIDYSRVSLMGECSSAIGASLSAVRNPERYAAMFLLNPVLIRGGNRFGEDGRFARFPSFLNWLKERDPLLPAANLSLPISIVHDAADPAHGPLEHSLAFIDAAAKLGKSVSFERPVSPAGMWFQSTLEPKLRWLSQQRKALPQKFVFKSGNPTGPIAEFFTERFIVVRPTLGPESQLSGSKRVADEFDVAWRKINFQSCRVVRDIDLSPSEMLTSNLVLIGNPVTNKVWGDLAKYLPVSLRESQVTVPGASIPIKNYALQAWCSHPFIQGRKLLLLGGWDCSSLKFGTLELEIDGWFDFAVWDASSDHPRLLLADRYKIFQ